MDFVVCRQGTVLELIQVSYSLEDKTTFKREVSALTAASAKTNCDNLLVICLDDSRDIEVDGKTVRIQNAVEWLLAE